MTQEVLERINELDSLILEQIDILSSYRWDCEEVEDIISDLEDIQLKTAEALEENGYC